MHTNRRKRAPVHREQVPISEDTMGTPLLGSEKRFVVQDTLGNGGKKEKRSSPCTESLMISGTPGKNRTCDLRIRNLIFGHHAKLY